MPKTSNVSLVVISVTLVDCVIRINGNSVRTASSEAVARGFNEAIWLPPAGIGGVADDAVRPEPNRPSSWTRERRRCQCFPQSPGHRRFWLGSEWDKVGQFAVSAWCLAACCPAVGGWPAWCLAAWCGADLGGWAGLRWAAWCLAGWCPTAVRGLLLCCRRSAGDGGRSWCGVCLMSGQADRGAGEDGGQDSGDGDAGSVGAHRAGWRRGGRWLHQPQVGGGDAGGGAEACLFAQLDSSLQVQLRGVGFVVAQGTGALLVTEEHFGGGVADEMGGVDAHVEDVLPGLPAAGQREDGLDGADEADHRGPVAPFGGEFDQGERGLRAPRGIGAAGQVAGGEPADELAGGCEPACRSSKRMSR